MKGGNRFFNSQPLSGGAFFLPKKTYLRSGFLGSWQVDTPCTPVQLLKTEVSNTRSAAPAAINWSKYYFEQIFSRFFLDWFLVTFHLIQVWEVF